MYYMSLVLGNIFFRFIESSKDEKIHYAGICFFQLFSNYISAPLSDYPSEQIEFIQFTTQQSALFSAVLSIVDSNLAKNFTQSIQSAKTEDSEYLITYGSEKIG